MAVNFSDEVGLGVGDLVGVAVGNLVGGTVGSAVGGLVGDAVGAGVIAGLDQTNTPLSLHPVDLAHLFASSSSVQSLAPRFAQ
eukprot:CAMPEP_0203636800 /NCGR_PEP_ID=MMETSP0088-20131115/3276_1 /ASSEMBLY_ACC=CAM_ASM_001087 /TAXON_ID=426623 /ORGANISM="Chaetoceros affinis, Strain CCMP159" /LENGTH=82 /DNA_ID=CAMNT_0050491055 /DNA_START=475 /DNA_END=723 /DNA_ORIENTATION=+